MVSWVDRGLDLEKEGEGEGGRGDNGIEAVRNWLMHEIQKEGKGMKNDPNRKSQVLVGGKMCTAKEAPIFE